MSKLNNAAAIARIRPDVNGDLNIIEGAVAGAWIPTNFYCQCQCFNRAHLETV